MRGNARPPGSPRLEERITDIDFIKLIEANGVNRTARLTGRTPRSVHGRRQKLEKRLGIKIKNPLGPGLPKPPPLDAVVPGHTHFPWRVPLQVRNGTIIIFGDAHYWPKQRTVMHAAVVFLCKELKPKAVITIGDILDAPSISRFTPIGWEQRPKLSDEIETAQDRLHEIKKAAGRVPTMWALGNHDARFETRLATLAPEYAKIHGVHLKDHFPLWEPGWACWVNNGELVAKHRHTRGMYGPYNSTIKSGKSMAVGDQHSARVMPFSDYDGTRYGVDVGCIAEPYGKQFVDYTEDNSKDWRSAFGVFTFRDGKLLMPELVTKWGEKQVQFRGDVFTP